MRQETLKTINPCNYMVLILTVCLFGTFGQLHAQVIALGRHHTAAILSNGSVKAWGWNVVGELGQGHTNNIGDDSGEMGENLPAVDLGAGRTATAIACGDDHTAVILDNGSVKVWGYNNHGQLGQGHTNALGDDTSEMGDNLSPVDLGIGRTATAIACGSSHTAVILDNGTVKVWGYNNQGQLGQGHTDDLGDEASEMGENLLAVDLGSGRTATAIACGQYHTAVILDNGTVKVWGYNNHGQLGQGHTNALGDDTNEMGDNLPAVALGSGRTATVIACGLNNTAVILDNGTVKTWGRFGGLGQGDIVTLGDDPSEMGDNLSAVALGTSRTALSIACGKEHTAVILDDATVKIWGINDEGQLGQGHTNVLGDNNDELGDSLSTVSLGSGRTADQLATGCFSKSSGVRLDNGTVKIWGHNDEGQLGQGHTNSLGDDPNEMGNDLVAVDLSISDVSLPVELSNFTASVSSGKAIHLEWITESETDNLGFIVDRRTDGKEWKQIASYITHPGLQGQGSVTKRTEYAFTDDSVEMGFTYDYRLADVSYGGVKEYHSLAVVGSSLITQTPQMVEVSPAYPNPFNPTTMISFSLPSNRIVNIVIYDVVGRKVANVTSAEYEAGSHSVIWNAGEFDSGLYIYHLQSGSFVASGKLILIK